MMHLGSDIKGLSDDQVKESRAKYGKNEIEFKKENAFIIGLKNSVKEPMLIILLIASVIYFINGSLAEGIFLSGAIILITSISLYQESRSRDALKALKSLTQPKGRVIRDGAIQEIPIEELVLGDFMMIEEGASIPADGIIIQANDFAVNESILTGEALPVNKSEASENNKVYQGTLVVGGLAICNVEQIGINTKMGQIGKSIQQVKEEKSPLQLQIADFVKKMALAGIVIFILVWVINYFKSKLFLDSLLKALTLAMSILPEEIPVAFATFMALGAWRLMKLGIIVKQTKTVETLGSATVICVDKTGTITENKMTLAKVYVHAKNKIINNIDYDDSDEVISMAMWASEPIPFDPMEKALHQAYEEKHASDERSSYKLIHEYPLSGRPPMMTHIFKNDQGNRIIAVKGAPEALIEASHVSGNDKTIILEAVNTLASEGYRVLGIGAAEFESDNYPETQQEFNFDFKGLVAFYDPPKENISFVLQEFYKAGINVKIITGDNAATTTNIAKQINFLGLEHSITGEELIALTDKEVNEKVIQTNIFTRMFPEAKLRIINALKNQNQIVAMTGDGVNDGPALKAAHIGIAMGKKGSEIAKQASALILVDDDLAKMVDAVAMGRKIYSNLKKAIQYIISIHIPIILIVFIPLILGWIYPTIFSPIHVIFLELIMGPTCSIIYENEPLEKNIMFQKPRPFSSTFFNLSELLTSIVQGLIITVGMLFIYQFAVHQGLTEQTTRAMVFITLVTANIVLTLVNRSFYYSIIAALHWRNNLIPIIICITLALLISILTIPLLSKFFQFQIPDMKQVILSIATGFLSVIWFEGIKFYRRYHSTS